MAEVIPVGLDLAIAGYQSSQRARLRSHLIAPKLVVGLFRSGIGIRREERQELVCLIPETEPSLGHESCGRLGRAAKQRSLVAIRTHQERNLVFLSAAEDRIWVGAQKVAIN